MLKFSTVNSEFIISVISLGFFICSGGINRHKSFWFVLSVLPFTKRKQLEMQNWMSKRRVNMEILEKRVPTNTLLFYLPFQRVESLSFHFVPYGDVCGGSDGEEGKKRQQRDQELRTPVLSYELTQAKVPNLAIKMHLKQLCAPLALLLSSLSSSPSSFLVLLAVCQPLHRADHLNSDPAPSFKVVHRADAARKPVTRRETKGIWRMERHSEFH